MNKIIILMIVISMVLLIGCQSSYKDCMYECKYKIYKDICTQPFDIWDGCTDEEARQRNSICFDECS